MPSETINPVIIPRDVSVEQNIAAAQDYAATHTIPETYYWFYLKVRNGGDWDYKQQGRQYEEFGNRHYGAIGAAIGIPDEILLRMAGTAQLRAGTSTGHDWGTPLGGAPYGDDPADQEAIQRGIEWARENGHETFILFHEHQINLPISWRIERSLSFRISSALDRNANGTIDNGRKIFGVDYLKYKFNGARHGR